MGRAKRVVLVDLLQWQEPIEGTTPQQYSHHRAARGDTVELGKAALERAEGRGWVAAPDEAAEALADTASEVRNGPVPAGEAGDAELAAMGAVELIAYVNQHPEEAARVNTLELARGEAKARKTVLQATEPLIGSGDVGSAG